jgi:ferredoxin-NADP reductase
LCAIDAFEPGQFVNVALRIDGELVFRAYSLASPPGEPLEFYLTEVQGGRLTPRLCQLEPGDSLFVEQHPQGFFTLRYLPDAAELWMIAPGLASGLTCRCCALQRFMAAFSADFPGARCARALAARLRTRSSKSSRWPTTND